MAIIKDITDYLESIAPLYLQEHYDNSGLITGNAGEEVRGILVTLDSTEEIVDEAIEKNCNLIVAHHPIVFKGLKKLTGENYVERTVMKCIKNDISLYAIHTNLDNVSNGVNAKIAERLALTNTRILHLKEGESEKGAGMIGELSRPIPAEEFLHYVSRKMECRNIRYTSYGQDIQKVAICGGAGSFLLSAAKKAGADVFITGDFKYHEFFDAENELMIMDIGHYESEVFTKDLLHDFLREKFSNIAVALSEANTNPVNYFYTNG